MLTRLDKDLNEMLLTGKTFDPGYDSLSIIDEGYDENDLLNSTISSQSNSMFSISNESGILCGQEVLMSSTPTKNSSKSATNNQNSAPKDGSLNGPFFERPKSLKEKYCVPDTSMENRIQHWRDMINLKLDIDKSNTYKLKSYRKYLLDCLSKSKENGCTVDDFISSNPDSGYGRFVLAALQLVSIFFLFEWHEIKNCFKILNVIILYYYRSMNGRLNWKNQIQKALMIQVI